jgi:hypothetical protein
VATLPEPVIQVIPPGLLSILQLKNGGRTPQHLGPDVLPTFDLEGYFLRATQQVITASEALVTTANDAKTLAAVPDSEWWFVEHFTANWFIAAGDLLPCAVLRMVSAGKPIVMADAVAVEVDRLIADHRVFDVLDHLVPRHRLDVVRVDVDHEPVLQLALASRDLGVPEDFAAVGRGVDHLGRQHLRYADDWLIHGLLLAIFPE